MVAPRQVCGVTIDSIRLQRVQFQSDDEDASPLDRVFGKKSENGFLVLKSSR